jgi:hypothetical protein
MSEIVERAARAVAEYYGEDPDEVEPLAQAVTGKALARWRKYVPVAAAVLEAIREPNRDMVNAALHWQDHCGDVDSLFSEMVGAALHGPSAGDHPRLKLYFPEGRASEGRLS